MSEAGSAPGLLRCLGGVVYETLTIVALLLLASAVATAIFGPAAPGAPRVMHQILDIGIVSIYFIWCWTHGGQTLAMKTWRIQVVDKWGRPLTLQVAFVRYCVAFAGCLMAGAGLWWALLDKDRLFLHDRLAHTRLQLKPA